MYKFKREYLKEAGFQLLLVAVLFFFYAFEPGEVDLWNGQLVEEKQGWDFSFGQVILFMQYLVAALFINYFLLPRFFYPKKYVAFVLALLVVIGAVALIEEQVLEKIFYPETRGKSFPGIMFTLIEMAPVILIMVGAKFSWDAIRKQKEVDQLKLAMKESELQFLKMQINPHFLFNSLNNLYAFALEKSPKTPHIILELSALLRYMLHDCREDRVSLSKELEHLKQYISLNKLQIEGRGEVFTAINCPPNNFKIAPLILSVFIENAFKHSTSSQASNIAIDVSVELIGNQLHFICANSFFEQSNTENWEGGIGLDNVKNRLNLIYPGRHELEIKNTLKRFIVELKINLKDD